MIRALPAPLSLPSVPWLQAVGLAIVVLFGIGNVAISSMLDARAYWEASLGPDTYAQSRIGETSVMYSPAFLFWTEPLRWAPFEVTKVLVMVAQLGSLVFLVGAPVAALLLVADLQILRVELGSGNLNLVAGALVVLALSRSAWWGPLALTKLTPAVGGLWHVARGEWRLVAFAAAATMLLALPAVILFPGLWVDWLSLLAGSVDAARDRTGMPLWIRGPVAVALIWWAARTDRAWVVPLAVVMALPVTWEGALIGLGAVRLSRLRAGSIAGQPGVLTPATGGMPR